MNSRGDGLVSEDCGRREGEGLTDDGEEGKGQ